VSDRVRALERAIEVALTGGVGIAGLLLVAGLLLGASEPLRWGILLLMATPVVRVTVMTVGLLSQRDWRFGLVSLFVLGVLASGIWVGLR
jgi:uncharacterized membrane protein